MSSEHLAVNKVFQSISTHYSQTTIHIKKTYYYVIWHLPYLKYSAQLSNLQDCFWPRKEQSLFPILN